MPAHRDALVEQILIERLKQFNLPGSEFDARNTPNDWVAIATHYIGENVRRGGNLPDRAEFEDSLVKAAAVILAALEYIPTMVGKGDFRD